MLMPRDFLFPQKILSGLSGYRTQKKFITTFIGVIHLFIYFFYEDNKTAENQKKNLSWMLEK